jgi:hypothetical protein
VVGTATEGRTIDGRATEGTATDGRATGGRAIGVGATEVVATEVATEMATEEVAMDGRATGGRAIGVGATEVVATEMATEVVATEVATEMATEVAATEGWVTGAAMAGDTGRLAMGVATEAIGAISTRIDAGLVSTSGGSESLLDDLVRHPSTRVFGGRALLSYVEQQQRGFTRFFENTFQPIAENETAKGDPFGARRSNTGIAADVTCPPGP